MFFMFIFSYWCHLHAYADFVPLQNHCSVRKTFANSTVLFHSKHASSSSACLHGKIKISCMWLEEAWFINCQSESWEWSLWQKDKYLKNNVILKQCFAECQCHWTVNSDELLSQVFIPLGQIYSPYFSCPVD